MSFARYTLQHTGHKLLKTNPIILLKVNISVMTNNSLGLKQFFWHTAFCNKFVDPLAMNSFSYF